MALMTLEKSAWLFAVLTSWTVAAVLFFSGYEGYGWVALAVGVAASINLLGDSNETD